MLNQLSLRRFGNRSKTHGLFGSQRFKKMIGKLIDNPRETLGAGMRKIQKPVSGAEIQEAAAQFLQTFWAVASGFVQVFPVGVIIDDGLVGAGFPRFVEAEYRATSATALLQST
ncbi:hypothetical protein D9M68_867700 [compost metagenome]